jgi:hypothetical protein
MWGTAYEGPVDWLMFPLPSDPDVKVHAHANFLMSRWECMFGKCPGLTTPKEETFASDIGCCGDSFYVNDAEDHRNIQARVQQLTADDWDSELRSYVMRRGYAKGASTDEEALARGWQHWKNKPASGTLDPDDTEYWSLKGRIHNGACIFANRSTGNVGKTGKIGCAFLHAANRQAEAVQLDDDGTNDARHDLAMPVVCHQLPLRTAHDYEDVWVPTEPENGIEMEVKTRRLVKITIRPWDANEWPAEAGHEYSGHWWCVDDPASYTAETALHTRMRGSIERIIGVDGYARLVQELERRAQTIAPMPILDTVRPQGRPLIPLAVAGKTMVKPNPTFETAWERDLKVDGDGKAVLID